jgi:hypothetical protein
MMKPQLLIVTLLLCVAPAMFAADGAKALRGTVETVDLTADTVEIKTPDGIFYTVTVTETVDLDGGKSKHLLLRGLKKGTVVVAHGVVEGGKFTADGLYTVGKGGLKVSIATVKAVGDGGKFLVVTTGKGAEATYHITSAALSKTAQGTVKGTKVVIYSTAKAGKKVAHFFEEAV